MADTSEPPAQEVFISEVQTGNEKKSGRAIAIRRTPSAISVVALSSVMAVAKNLMFPLKAADLPSGSQIEKLPQWFSKDFMRKAVFHTTARSIVQDTVLLSVATGLWHGSLRILEGVRQTEDVMNKGVAGLITGGFLTAANQHWQYHPYELAMQVGVWLFHAEKRMEARLLESQQKLEREVLQVPEGQLHQQFVPELFQRLVQLKQQAMMDAHPPASHLKKLLDKAKDQGLDSGEWQDLMKSAPWTSQDAEVSSAPASERPEFGQNQ